jgi:DNA-binding NarL/FixJ family response regulator
VRVLVATDRPSLGAALSLFLSERDVEVVGVVGQAEDVVASSLAARPDIVLVDCHLANAGGGEVVAELKDRACAASVIVLGFGEDAVSSHHHGADGFATLGDTPDSLLALMREVMSRPPLSLPPYG